MIKYNLTIEQKADLLERYIVNNESIKEMHNDFKDIFETYNKFYCYLKRLRYEKKVLKAVKNPSKLIVDRLRVYDIINPKAYVKFGSKKESYWKNEEEMFFNPCQMHELSNQEQEIYDNGRSNEADLPIQFV